MLPFLQISNDVLGYGELFIGAFSAVGLVLIGYLTLKRTPLIPTELQKTVAELSKNFEQHLKDDEKRFSDLWKISNDIRSENKQQAADLALKISEAKLANAEGQTDIKVQLGQLVTSVAYIEGEIKRGFVEKP